jgi:two-component system response regulator (stage 0 sporulation protein A)
MQTNKLLIADSSEELCRALNDLLGQRYHICTCHSGDRALELLRSFSPDLIYIDLMLPQIDGLAVLQTALQEGIRPAMLVSVGLQSPYIERALSRLQVDYVLKKPCSAKVIAGHIDELAGAAHGAPVKASDLQAEIAGILVQLGFKNNLSGFRYVVSGLPMFAENPQQTVTKELYPAIGKLHGKTGEQVERAIRNAIELAWQRKDERIWRMYFAPAPDGSIPRPTNGQLLHTLMRQISGLQKDEKIG